MKREIKFRAWSLKDKILAEVENINWSGKIHVCYKKGNPKSGYFFGGNYIGDDWEKDEYVLMQYTGLKDKNGKEIYEGDIIKGQFKHYDPILDSWREDEKMGGIVFWDLYGWRIEVIESLCEKERIGMVNYFDFSINGVYWASKEFEDIEVIGNRYENPELLQP